MLTLHFIRHGQTNFNLEKRVQGQFDSVLTKLGIQQATDLKPNIENLALSAVYSSTNIRARQTAEILTENVMLGISYKDELREIMMGPWQERLYSDVARSHPDQMDAFTKDPENFALNGAETFAQVQSRGVRTIDAIIKSEQDGHVLIVSHGVMIKTILCHYAKVSLKHVWDQPHLANCSQSIIEVHSKGDCSITRVGDKPSKGTIWIA